MTARTPVCSPEVLAEQIERALERLHGAALALWANNDNGQARKIDKLVGDIERIVYGPASRPDVNCDQI